MSVLNCFGARSTNDSGPVLDADDLQVDQNAFFDNGFAAIGDGRWVVLDFDNAVVGGSLYFNPEQLAHRTHKQHALNSANGLVYSGLPIGISAREWLALLREGTPKYAAQQYQHLAAAHRAAGHDREARQVLVAQRRDQIHRRALTGRTERAWARLTGVFLGYGYQPWRALIGLLTMILMAVLLSVALGDRGALAQVRTPPSPTQSLALWWNASA